MDDTFFRVLFPGEHRVLGRTLPPFSFWHLACLYALESPFTQDDGEITLADIQLAVKVCATRWPAAPDLRPTFRDAWERWRFESRVDVVHREALAFKEYREAYSIGPRFWENEDEIPRRCSAPWILARVAQLERLTKFSNDQAWNDVPPGYATWLTSTINEQLNGNLRFLYDEDEEDDGLPDLSAMDDSTLYDLVKAERGAAFADQWLNARQQERKGNN